MEYHPTVRETVCMRELQVAHSYYRTSHFFDAGDGKENSSFGYIVKGSVVLDSFSESIAISEGSLFYIPEGQRYHSTWTGTPDIEFYSVHIVHNQLNVEKKKHLSMQYIPQFSKPETLQTFQMLFSLLGSEEPSDRIRGVSLFYQWYCSVFPLLQALPLKKHSPLLLKAVDYIQAHYTQNFDTACLAKYCCISESRLYHLFQEELRISPVQYKNIYRVEKAAQLLRRTDLDIEGIADSVGYNSPTYFRKVFKQVTGMTPSSYRHTVWSHGK